MGHYTTGTVTFLVAMLLASSLEAGQAIVPRPVKHRDVSTVLNEATAGCAAGNTNAPAIGVPGFPQVGDQFLLVFDPTAGSCATCTVGFRVSAITVLLETAAPCNIELSVSIEEAGGSPGCPEPGLEWCNSGPQTVFVSGAGVHEVSVPLSCPCLDPNRAYLIGFSLVTIDCEPALILDAGPALECTNYYRIGSLTVDLVVAQATWPGQLLFSADADCCGLPVPTEGATWGRIKSVFQ